jgi:hypothetical protein
LLSQARSGLLPRRAATCQRGAQRHDSQNTHFADPRPGASDRNEGRRAI